MGTSEGFLLFLFFLLVMLLTNIFVLANDCSISSNYPCSPYNLVPRFPFRIKDQQHESCGYPGFILTCKYLYGKATVLDLPLSGDFLVKGIDYDKQEIQLHDPNACLPKRLLNLNLLDSPFKSVYYQNYTFLNCTYQIVYESSISEHIINCLSGGNNFVLATSSMDPVRAFHRYCEVIKTVRVPVRVPVPIQFTVGYESAYLSNDYGSNLTLSWDEPDCRYCESRNQGCRLRNKSSHETRCFQKKRHKPGAISGIGIGLPVLVCIICSVVCCTRACSYDENQPSDEELSNATSPQSVIPLTSLNDSMIGSYPKIVLSESRRLPKPDDNTCSICLSEYLPKETLKIIPECNHNFHADCIDQWLRKKMSCPVCRNSPT